MKRLLERTWPPASLEADAAELFRATGPSAAEPAVKQRVRERLAAVRTRARPRFVMVPAIVVVGLAIGTAAGATLGVRWWREAREAVPPAPSVAAPSRSGALRRASPARPAARLPPREMSPETAPVPRAPERAMVGHPRRSNAGAAAEDGETRLLFEATRALRREQDPARAGALLDDYFRRFPRGVLAEEALAVAIEAAQARADARARDLARRYLARYPEGQFRKAAERALAGPPE
jgi:hypothetical protein